jgi:hypothetical protein
MEPSDRAKPRRHRPGDAIQVLDELIVSGMDPLSQGARQRRVSSAPGPQRHLCEHGVLERWVDGQLLTP